MQICRAAEVLIWRCGTHAARPTADTAAVTGPLLPDFQIRFNSRHPRLVSAAKHSGSKVVSILNSNSSISTKGAQRNESSCLSRTTRNGFRLSGFAKERNIKWQNVTSAETTTTTHSPFARRKAQSERWQTGPKTMDSESLTRRRALMRFGAAGIAALAGRGLLARNQDRNL